ncbi:MAG: hypothetical protein ACR2HH_12435 [Chthoniobacterales bacterium]
MRRNFADQRPADDVDLLLLRRGRGQGATKENGITGTWGLGEQDTGAGTWEGARAKRE